MGNKVERLEHYSFRYVEERRKRGEITKASGDNALGILLDLSRSFGRRPIDQFGINAIERWQESIGNQAATTRATKMSTVRGFCKWLVKHKVINRDPTAEITIRIPKRLPRAMPKEYVTKLLAACPDERARAIVTLMVEEGLRCVEVSRLEIADYDQVAGTLHVVGKFLHERLLPVTDGCTRALAQYLAVRGRVCGPMFTNTWTGEMLSPGAISHLLTAWISAAGIKTRSRDGVSAHALRHTAASDVLEQCGDVRTVQEMLGHTSLATTQIYLRRVTTGRLREAMEGRSYSA